MRRTAAAAHRRGHAVGIRRLRQVQGPMSARLCGIAAWTGGPQAAFRSKPTAAVLWGRCLNRTSSRAELRVAADAEQSMNPAGDTKGEVFKGIVPRVHAGRGGAQSVLA